MKTKLKGFLSSKESSNESEYSILISVISILGVLVCALSVYIYSEEKLRTTATDPDEIGFYVTPGWAEDVALAGDYAYIADLDSGLRIVDVSEPTSPSEV